MKKKFSLFLITFFFLTINNAYAKLACKSFYKSMNEYSETYDLDNDPYTEYVSSVGFYLDQYYDKSIKDFLYTRDKDNYFKVGKIFSKDLLNSKLKKGDILLSINGQDVRNNSFIRDEKIYFEDIFNDNDNKVVLGKLNNNKIEKYEIKIKKEKISVAEPFIDLLIKSISIDEKKGTFDATVVQDFAYYFSEDDILVEIAAKHLAGSFCYPPLTFMRDNDYSRPDWGLKYENLISRDKSLFSEKYIITPFYNDAEKISDLEIKYNSEGVYRFKENYNLRNFPFDKQKLKIWLHQTISPIEGYHAIISSMTEINLDEFSSKKNNIPGWKITKAEINYKTNKAADENFYDGVEVAIEIERKSSYYIFKIIFPIILILAVCWSAVWIDPKEIESRLTVTIVCLLSLIAYNFVIDSELPKLEYLTIMDYIILVSYIYATIPNFLSIYSFELQKKNRKLTEKYEQYEKKYGLPSYLAIIILIVFINTSASPDHAISSLSWLTNSK